MHTSFGFQGVKETNWNYKWMEMKSFWKTEVVFTSTRDMHLPILEGITINLNNMHLPSKLGSNWDYNKTLSDITRVTTCYCWLSKLQVLSKDQFQLEDTSTGSFQLEGSSNLSKPPKQKVSSANCIQNTSSKRWKRKKMRSK